MVEILQFPKCADILPMGYRHGNEIFIILYNMFLLCLCLLVSLDNIAHLANTV